ncbi:MAG: hypothetical protein JJU27_15530 [Gammaproteobacteria bacterium]|nr:hypothetical protein [Gammaproteobacteria bacterium]
MSGQTTSLSAAADELLAERLGDELPQGVLMIAAAESPACLQAFKVVKVSPEALPDALPAGRRVSAGVVVDALSGLSHAQGAQLLARLRDQLCARVFVVTGAHGAWSRQDMLALGFTLRERSADGQWLLFDHDVASYNPERDWNTPEHWANPENFKRYRW